MTHRIEIFIGVRKYERRPNQVLEGLSLAVLKLSTLTFAQKYALSDSSAGALGSWYSSPFSFIFRISAKDIRFMFCSVIATIFLSLDQSSGTNCFV